MVLTFHILVALVSLLSAGFMYFYPTKTRLKVTLFLATATLASGSYLIVSTPSHLLQSCVMGLIYLGVLVYAVVSARQKIAKVTSH